ncbi:spore germination protein [Fictibacillus iocasae]|uniref:Spore germination protein n=1 Tax=Fictibacillus iocasae TaxID=2715437 RepID=A0ABW2NN15_9BACL
MSNPFFKRRKQHKADSETQKPSSGLKVSSSLNENIQQLHQIFGKSMDVKIIEFLDGPLQYTVCYIEGLINKQQLDLSIIEPIKRWLNNEDAAPHKPELLVNQIEAAVNIHSRSHFDQLITPVLKGHAALFVEGLDEALDIPLETWEFRGVEEPESQTMVRGPREGFVETLQINTTLLRRRISQPDLRFIPYIAGEITKTTVLIAHLESHVDKQVLHEVTERIQNVKTDKLFESGMMEELIDENGYSPFPLFQSTERPDVAAAALTEGKVVIMFEGTPFVLITPTTFISFFQAAEDYYHHFDLSTFIRLIRVISFIISISLPAAYIAVTTFHQELIPTNLLVSLAAQREGVPFPAFVEALMMEIIFEILREAGIRMPRPIGSAVSIVGAIVIGESAVAAGLVSPAIVIVVSLTAISSFVSPYYGFSGAARLLRFVLMALAATTGIFGMIFFLFGLVIHLCSLTSMGKPYFSPLAPFQFGKHKDTLLRFPLWWTETKLYKNWVKKG